MIDKTGPFRITPLLERNPIHQEYMERMVRETLEGPRPPKPIPTTEQPLSTAAALKAQALRDPSEDLAWANRALPENAQVKDENGNIIFNEREVSISEMLLFEDTRRKSKNTRGQSDLSSITPERREKGILAYTYSKPAELTPEEKKRVTKLEPIKSELFEPEEPPKKLTLLEKMFGWTNNSKGKEGYIRIYKDGQWKWEKP